jgi:hypothetical protein
VGYYAHEAPDQGARGFLWEDGHITELHELLDGAPDADARRINSAGVIVGVAYEPTRAVRWIEGRGEFLEVIPGFAVSGATGVNDAGRIIGRVAGGMMIPPGGGGLLWQDGVMYRIHGLIAATNEFAFVNWPRAISSDFIVTEVRTEFPEFDDRDVLRSIPPVPGDTTCNGEVDFHDLLNVLSQWGPAESSTADLDESGVIGSEDLEMVLANWGR